MKTIESWLWVCLILVLIGGCIYKANTFKDIPQTYTKYQAYYDNEHINCNIMTVSKNCANLSDCDDKNSYFCVQNVKMFVDKK